MRKNKLALFTFALAAFNFAGKSSEKISLPKEMATISMRQNMILIMMEHLKK